MGSVYTQVFTPVAIKSATFKNRIFCNTVPAGTGVAAARGGAAAVVAGSISLDHENAHKVHGLYSVAQKIARYGALPGIELTHPGMYAAPRGETLPVGPSGIRGSVTEADPSIINALIRNFADTAKRLSDLGFHIITLDCAHGSLPAQFISPLCNHRSDNYGGALRNRARFVIEILDAIRSTVGDSLIIEYRVSAEEYVEGGMHLEDTVRLIKLLGGKIDLLHVTSGLPHLAAAARYISAPYCSGYNTNVKFARELKKHTDIPVVIEGSIINVECAERMLKDGSADFVSLTRPFLADPDIVRKSAANLAADVIPCLRCNSCKRSATTFCAVNPLFGKEHEFPEGRAPKSLSPKKVAVIGGGAAGMTAACTAAERGHSVTLFEASGSLGGHLRDAATFPFKQDMARYLKYAIARAERLVADIRLNTLATPELIEQEAFESLIVAVGSEIAIPDIPGIDRPIVHHVMDTDTGEFGLGFNILIIGGGILGYEAAIGFARDGRGVTIIDNRPLAELPQGAGERYSSPLALELVEMAKASGVKEYGGAVVHEINDFGAIITDSAGKRVTLPADTVFYATGVTPRNEFAESFRHIISECEVFFAGDCAAPGTVGNAVTAGWNAAMSV